MKPVLSTFQFVAPKLAWQRAGQKNFPALCNLAVSRHHPGSVSQQREDTSWLPHWPWRCPEARRKKHIVTCGLGKVMPRVRGKKCYSWNTWMSSFSGSSCNLLPQPKWLLPHLPHWGHCHLRDSSWRQGTRTQTRSWRCYDTKTEAQRVQVAWPGSLWQLWS